MDLTRTRMDRIFFIIAEIRRGKYPNCPGLAKEWARHIGSERPFDRKTISRDIGWLRDFHRAPIEWSPSENGYYYTDKSWVMPSMRLNEGELLALLLARQMGKVYEGTPVADSLEGLFAKLRDSLNDPVVIDPLLMSEQFSFHHHPSRPIREDVWLSIFRGIREGHTLRFQYQGLYDEGIEKREIEPVHLANVDDDWYLVGFCLDRQDWRHFSVSRISSAAVTNRPFVVRDGFNAEQHFANRFGRFIARQDAPQHQVTIRFSPVAAPRILERTWHPRQKLKKGKDGSITLSMPLPSLIEAKRFCLGWGKEMTVLEPESLRKELAEEAKVMRKNHAGRT